ncbi:MAG: metal-dependent hydrolase [Nanopusillaceae archaeon]
MILKLHFSISLILSYIIYFVFMDFDRYSALSLSIITAKFSTLPDMDYKISSWVSKQISILERKKIYYFVIPYYLFLKFLAKMFKHRGITHSIYFVLLFLFLKFVFSNIFFILALSFALHILEDIFTVSGVEIFYPLSNFKVRIPLFNNRYKEIQDKISIGSLILFFIIFLLL